MKKLTALLLALVLTLALAACGGSQPAEPEPEPEPEELPLTDFEICAEYAIGKLKDRLKDPNSLQVNHLYGVENAKKDSYYVYKIDYSAENSFGGSVRDNFFIEVGKTENGFAVSTYGYSDVDNQNYTAKSFKDNSQTSYFEFDSETYRITAEILTG